MPTEKFGMMLYKEENSKQRIPNSIYVQTNEINLDGKLLFVVRIQLAHNMMNSNFMNHDSPGQIHNNHPHFTQQNFSNI